MLKEELKIGVTAVSTVLEEVNMHGVMASHKDYNVALVLDVDFATDVPTDHPEMGELRLGGGFGLNINADSNVVLRNLMQNVSEQYNIPRQLTVSRNLSGGTDAARLQSCGNIATLNVNLPLRYMHSRYEMCDIRDVEHAVNAIVGFVKHINDNKITNFVPWKQ